MCKRSWVLQLAACSALLLALSCQPTQPVATPKPVEKGAAAAPTKAAEKPVRGGTLRVIPNTFGAESLDANVSAVGNVIVALHDSLVEPDAGWNPTKEGLTRDWTISGDGKSITLKLREGVKFHDGTVFDAAAVKSNLERVKDPANKATYRTSLDSVASVEVVDSLTVRLNVKQPDPLLLGRLVTGAGLMVSPAAVKKYGQDIGRNPVGIGPFQFVEWTPDGQITLKRFEGYWRKDKDGDLLPYLDGVVFKLTTDPTVSLAELRTGQLDAMRIESGQLPLVKNDPNLTTVFQKDDVYDAFFLNTKKPPFNNKALRQAIALAMDRQGIAGRYGPEVGVGQASVFHPLMTGVWDADGKAGVFPARDVAKAKAKLAEAGYPSGGLKVKINTQNTPDYIKDSEILQANLAEIGITAELEVLASTAHSTRTRIEMDYQIATGRPGRSQPDPGDLFGIAFHSKGSRNYYGPYGNPQVDQLLDRAANIYDQKERAALYQQAGTLIADDLPLVTTVNNNRIYPMSKKVRGYPIYGDSIGRLWGTWLAQ